MKFLSRLLLWQKLLLLVVALLVPAALLAVFYLGTANESVQRARMEISGARYTHAIDQFLLQVINHRGQSNALLNGDASRKDAVLQAQSAVEKAIAEVDAVNSELDRQLGTSADWQSLKSEWSSLRSRVLTLPPDDSFAQHNELVMKILDFAASVAMKSGMARDPDASTSTLVSLATNVMPEAVHRAGIVRGRTTSGVLRGYLGEGDRTMIDTSRQEVAALLAQIDRQLNWIAAEEAAVRSRVLPAFQRARDAFSSYSTFVDEKLLKAQQVDVSGTQMFDAAANTFDSFVALTQAAYDVMVERIEARAAGQAAERNWTIAIVAGVVLLSLALSWLITSVVTRPMAHAVKVFDSISNGHYDNEIRASGHDEVASVLRALEDMQSKLRQQIETERRQAAENARVRVALDSVSSNVLLMDADFRIIYTNPSLETMLRAAESDIRRDLPQFNVATMRGAPIDVLLKNPSQERQALADLHGSRTTQVVLGGRTFRQVVSPVIDSTGTRVGTVMEWTDRTQEVAIESELQNMLSAVLSGDLEQRIAMEGKQGFFEMMCRGVNQLADNLTEIVRRVKIAAQEVYRGAEEISAGNANLSQRTEEQSSSLEETASSMEQMTSTVKQNADNAGHANQLAMAARDQAEKGGTVVAQAVRAMADINEASKKIADIIGVIDEIAFQTNLLALNAAVEAARAGEQGRGFAVVASEVRNLAGRSATAAKEIKDLIQDSVRKVQDGSLLVTQSGQTLEQIVASVKKVSDIVAEIAAASREQSSGIEQVNRAVMQMDELTQQNAALVEQATAASQAMADQARQLNEMMAKYKVRRAITEIRVGESQGASTASESAADQSTKESASASKTAAAPRVERRGPNRPWSGRTASAPPPAMDLSAIPLRKRAAAAGDNDSEWQEF